MILLLEDAGPAAGGSAAAAVAMTGATALVHAMLDLGVDTVFGRPGTAVAPLVDALFAQPRLRTVLLQHEPAAVHAAQGYARSTGRMGVVIVDSGASLANAAGGLFGALCDSVPIVCISAQRASATFGTDASGECDAIGISCPVTRWNVQVNHGAALAPQLRKAFAIAAGGRPGPVLLSVPASVLLHAAPPPCASPALALRRATPQIKPRSITAIAQALLDARQPVFLGGGGLVRSGPGACASFSRIVSLTGAPCALTLMGLGALPGSHPHSLGMIGPEDHGGRPEARLAVQHADLLVCIGTRLDARMTGPPELFCPSARLVHIDIDPVSINAVLRADLPLVGDCGQVLAVLLAQLQRSPPQPCLLAPWWQRIAGWRAQRRLAYAHMADRIAPQALFARLQAQLEGRDAVVAVDAGPQQMWTAQHLCFEQPRRWLAAGGSGTPGFALPAALGAQIAHPHKTVVCVCSDASIAANLPELASARQQRTPVKLVLCNGGRRGLESMSTSLDRAPGHGTALPDWVTVARGFGWRALRVGRRAQLDAALAQCLASREPFLLDVRVGAQPRVVPAHADGCGAAETRAC
jgi:acetolactate synthase I/II/III large subunit